MKNQRKRFAFISSSCLLFGVVLSSSFTFQACDQEDPDPVNEEEVITTLTVTLAPDGEGSPVSLSFYDADGEQGSIAPVISVSGPLEASTSYVAVIGLTNQTVSPPLNISEEVAGEADEHLFCFDVTGDVAIAYEDEDENGLPLGLVTSWTTGSSGEASVTLILRHQSGTKTGECPGTGETDVEVTFDLLVE